MLISGMKNMIQYSFMRIRMLAAKVLKKLMYHSGALIACDHGYLFHGSLELRVQ